MKKSILFVWLCFWGSITLAQNPFILPKKELQFFLNEEKTEYIKMTFLAQNWVRYTQNNPYSTVMGFPQENTFDIGLRRTRLQFFGQLSPRVFLYTQFGMNNFSYTSTRKAGVFFHDVVTEYAFAKDDKLSIGTGLAGWNGVARFASPGVASILALDAPLYQQFLNDVNDQFLRKMSVYAKGNLGKINYRLSVAKPLAITQSLAYKPLNNTEYSFSPKNNTLQYQAYLFWQFLDKEKTAVPYMTGTYLGKKKLLNVGIGAMYHADALWKLSGTDTLYAPLKIWNVDVFYDAPLNEAKGTALSAYLSLMHSDYGKNYIRNLGVMNPTTGTSKPSFAGAGNSFAMFGTGNVLYAQVGYLLKKELLKSYGTLQPYAVYSMYDFDALEKAGIVWEIGVNWLISGHNSKMTFNYQSRPVFETDAEGKNRQTQRKGMFVFQYQIMI